MGGFLKFVFGKKPTDSRGRAKGSVAEGIEKTKGELIPERTYEVPAFKEMSDKYSHFFHRLNDKLNPIR
jgi:hypothetical protein